MARKRGKYYQKEDNPERWLVSYADFVTLLFAFFVVMYSISSVNEAKYAHLSEALEEAFSQETEQSETVDPVEPQIDNKPDDANQKVIEPIQIGEPPTSLKPIILENPTREEQIKQHQLSEEILKERRQLNLISDKFADVLQPYLENQLVEVKKKDFWIELEMNSQLLFLSGEAELSRKASPIIKKIADVIRPMPNVINIEGHTDNIPIDTVEFPSNWDLSSARATSVVREFENNNISPKRLSAVGYGEFHPVADNRTVAGRLKNRRVVLVLMSGAFARYGTTDEERNRLLNIQRTDLATN